MFTFTASTEADTDRLGAALAEVLPPGIVIGLFGMLGAGKTRLVQAVARGLGVAAGAVTSPTFVLLHQYLQGCPPIYHFDAYRLRDDDEFLELGPEEYFEAGGITFIEWADRVSRCLPAERLEIRIELTGETERTFALTATTTELEERLVRLGKLVGSRQ
jgi:tRNA threonylcarbamoyladenosine biosynthesis protein TsaE